MHRTALLALLLFAGLAGAAGPDRQPIDALRAAAEAHLRREAQGLPGIVSVALDRIDPELSLPACPALQTFVPGGARPWGRTSVGVRCDAPRWTIQLPARVNVIVRYAVAARPLAAQQPLTDSDLAFAYGDLAQLPEGVVTYPGQALGRMPRVGIAAGQPLRRDLLRAPAAVQQGQPVRVVSRGRGFEISAEGLALTDAPAGQAVRVRMASGRIVSGIARPGAVVELPGGS